MPVASLCVKGSQQRLLTTRSMDSRLVLMFEGGSCEVTA